MSTTKKGQKKLNKRKKEKARGEKRREGFCGVLVLEVEKVRLREVLAERERERGCVLVWVHAPFIMETLLIRKPKSPRSNQEVGFGENYLRSLLSPSSLLDPTLLDYAVLLLFMGVLDLLPCLLWRRTKLVGWCFWFRSSVIMTSRF